MYEPEGGAGGQGLPSKETKRQEEGTKESRAQAGKIRVGRVEAGDPVAASRARKRNSDFRPRARECSMRGPKAGISPNPSCFS